MTVDVSKLREGDVVLVRGVLVANRFRENELSVELSPMITPHTGDLKIVSVEPRPLKVGDRVKRSHGEQVFTIAAIADGAALLRATASAHEVCGAFLENLSPA